MLSLAGKQRIPHTMFKCLVPPGGCPATAYRSEGRNSALFISIPAAPA